MDRFGCSRCLYNHIDRLDMMGSFTSGDTTSQVAKNRTKKLSQPFDEQQVLILDFKLNTPKPIIKTYFEFNLSRFGLAGLRMVAILDF